METSVFITLCLHTSGFCSFRTITCPMRMQTHLHAPHSACKYLIPGALRIYRHFADFYRNVQYTLKLNDKQKLVYTALSTLMTECKSRTYGKSDLSWKLFVCFETGLSAFTKLVGSFSIWFTPIVFSLTLLRHFDFLNCCRISKTITFVA